MTLLARQTITRITLFLIVVVLVHAAASLPAISAAQSAESSMTKGGDPPAFGVSVAYPDATRVLELGYDWMKIYDWPVVREPSNVLLRIDVSIQDYYSLDTFNYEIRSAIQQHGANVDAYEIGNEPNISSEWLAAPSANRYVDVLCTAYWAIKTYDPDATVVSAGIAPVGRINQAWNGHLGHDGMRQDEREFMAEFLAAEGHLCADAIGYHPMGFRADFDATPGVDGGTPETNCEHGLCFRSIERFHDVMLMRNVDRPIWATEVGWIKQPPAHCLTHPSWAGREWQIVTAEAQQANIEGALAYAEANYPWLETMFVFNLNFDEALWYGECEQMRFYSTDGPVRPFTRYFAPVIISD